MDCNKKTSRVISSLFFLAIFIQTLTLGAQNSIGSKDKILEDFDMIESQNRFLEGFGDFGKDDTAGEAYNLPIGIKKIAANIEFTLAITRVQFDTKKGTITLLMKMRTPQNKVLYFGADNIAISYEGDLVGDVHLYLLSDVPISLGNAGDVVIKGGYNEKTGAISSKTYASLDCNGELQELSIDGEVVLNKNTFKAVSKPNSSQSTTLTNDSLVRASFTTIVRDWNDLFVEISLPPFEIKGANGFVFSLTSATLDLSDYRTPTNFSPDMEYLSRYFHLPDINLWRGIYIDQFSITLPSQFKNKNSTERMKIQAERMFIDEHGITGLVQADNVIPFESGDASGWNFSVSNFKLGFVANNITGFGFGGQIGIPISKEQQVVDYKAFISKNEYSIIASLGEDKTINMFGDAKLKLEKTSSLQLSVKNEKFIPRVILDGHMDINTEGLNGDVITFKKLSIGADAPILSVESMGYAGDIKFNNFPVTISDIQLMTRGEEISLAFDAQVNLMADKIAAGTRLTLVTEYKDNKFAFKGLKMNALIIKGAQMSGFSLNGELRMEKDHPVYGRYFGGMIDATFGALSDDLTVGVTAIFGRKDFRYWYVEGRADFGGKGVPVGPLTINGFTGGIYYKMSSTGKAGLRAYEPNAKSSLGLKAGLSYFIAKDNTINGDALLETSFLSSGGIKNIKFYGTAKFMVGLDITDHMGKLGEMYEKAQDELADFAGSYTDKLPKDMNGSDVAKSVLPDITKLMNLGINAYMSMEYDFTTKTFDADFKVMVNVPGGFITGSGNNNEAGWAKLHLSPSRWYVYAGTPNNPLGLKLGLKPLTLKTSSYFMFGDRLEKPVPPPAALLNILKISATEADYMKYPKDISIGKGIAFGTRFEFDTGDLSFLILYARFMAGMGVDVMLADMSAYACEGESSPVGINGWHANGQCYAYLSGELGVRIKLFFIKKRITIIKGAAAALLQAKMPNPTWIGGRLAVELNVLGLIKASMGMKLSFGDECKLVRLDGEYSPLDFPLISDLSPKVGEEDVDVFFSPQGTFNMAIDTPFEVEDDEGNPQSYLIALEDFYVMDNKGQKIKGEVKWSRTKESAVFESFEILPPNMDMKAEVSVNFKEWKNGSWQMVTHGGKNARESKIVTFKTGGAPNYIPLTNIEYAYPVVNQKNFFQKETSQGYVQLKKGQNYLFPENFRYNTKFTAQNATGLLSDFNYIEGERKISYNLPETQNKTKYTLAFIALPDMTNVNTTSEPQKITSSTTLTDGEGEEFTMDYTQQAAQQILKDGELEVLAYTIRSSEFNTFAEKMGSLDLIAFERPVTSNTVSLLLKGSADYELFDEHELIGSDYTASIPLVEMEAILDDKYYIEDIAPLTYNWMPIRGISVKRDLSIGIPPIKHYPLYDSYLDYIINASSYNGVLARMFPYVYELPYRYSVDYYDLRNDASNVLLKAPSMLSDRQRGALIQLVESSFPFLRQGNYKTEFRYILPGGGEGTSKQLNYHNPLDWRK